MVVRRWKKIALIGFGLLCSLSLWSIFQFVSFVFKTPSEDLVTESHRGNLIHPAYGKYYHSDEIQRKYLAVLILSAPKEFQERQALRKTWLSTHEDTGFRFCVGIQNVSADDVTKIREEYKKNKDMILLNTFTDQYNKLTEKLLHCLSEMTQTLRFTFILKCDTDTFVNLKALIELLNSKLPEHLYMGFFDGRANVKRSGQWMEDKWILCDHYGPHARGGGYVLSNDLVSYIVTNQKMLMMYKSEDISVGAWLGPLHINRYHEPRFNTEYRSRGCSNEYIVTHKVNTTLMYEYWTNLQASGHICSQEYKLYNSYIYNWNVAPSQCCIRNDPLIP